MFVTVVKLYKTDNSFLFDEVLGHGGGVFADLDDE